MSTVPRARRSFGFWKEDGENGASAKTPRPSGGDWYHNPKRYYESRREAESKDCSIPIACANAEHQRLTWQIRALVLTFLTLFPASWRIYWYG